MVDFLRNYLIVSFILFFVVLAAAQALGVDRFCVGAGC